MINVYFRLLCAIVWVPRWQLLSGALSSMLVSTMMEKKIPMQSTSFLTLTLIIQAGHLLSITRNMLGNENHDVGPPLGRTAMLDPQFQAIFRSSRPRLIALRQLIEHQEGPERT